MLNIDTSVNESLIQLLKQLTGTVCRGVRFSLDMPTVDIEFIAEWGFPQGRGSPDGATSGWLRLTRLSL